MSSWYAVALEDTLPRLIVLPYGAINSDPVGTVSRMGVRVFGNHAEYPDMLRVSLPTGWRKRLIDRVEVAILDQAKRSRFRLLFSPSTRCTLVQRRYDIAVRRGKSGETPLEYAEVMSGPDRLFSSETFKPDGGHKGEAWGEAKSWLDRNYPDWQDPTAYW
jgi:hypothetical protein